jgi:hypothetical protein
VCCLAFPERHQRNDHWQSAGELLNAAHARSRARIASAGATLTSIEGWGAALNRQACRSLYGEEGYGTSQIVLFP